MDRTSRGGAEYVVDWTGQGYEQLAQQLRDFLALKRQVDAEIKRGFARGPASSGLVGAAGQPLVSAGRQADFAAQQQQQAQERTHQQQQRTERQRQMQEERAFRQEERTYQQAERAARRSDAASGRLHEQTTPNVFASMADTSGLKSDEDWLGYQQAIKARHETALKNNEQLNAADRKILGNANAVAGIIGQRKLTEEGVAKSGGLLGRVMNMASWMPFVPQELYLGQMALGEMGLGLGATGVAAGLGVGALGALGVGVFNTTASELQFSRMLAGISAGGSGTAVMPADQLLADQLTATGAGFGLNRQQMFSLLPTAAQYNLGNRAAIGGVVTSGLTVAAQGQLTNEQGVSLMGLLASRNGGDVPAAQREIVALDGAIKQMGADTHTVYGAILQDGTALRAGTDLRGFATVAAGLQGSGLGPMDLIGGAVQSSGVQRLSQAAALGMSEASFTTLQKDPAGMARRLQGYARQLMGETNSPSATEAILGAQGFISGSQNPDEVLHEMLTGNFKNPPVLAGPPAPPALQQAAFDQATVQAMTVNTLSLPLMPRLQLAGGTLMSGLTDLVNGQPNAPNAKAAAGIMDTLVGGQQLGGADQIARHIVDIILHQSDGSTTTVTYDTGGKTTQTPTTTPGQGPSASVGVTPSRTPNATNANGR